MSRPASEFKRATNITKCKIFTGSKGYLRAGIGKPQIFLEDAVNKFLATLDKDVSEIKIFQSQCGNDTNDSVTISIFY